MAHHHTFIETLQEATHCITAGDKLPDGLLVAILKRLTDSEIAEGGPYALDGRGPDVELNRAIGRFLQAYGIKLPNLDEFLVGTAASYTGDRSARDVVMKERPAVTLAMDSSQAAMIARIRAFGERRFASLSVELRENALHVLERTIAGNTDLQMTLMPYFMREALGARGRVFDDDSIAELGLANAFFWSAFIVYDDFWDQDEAAEPRFLPVANLFTRHYTSIFDRKSPDALRSLMDELDGANAWEIANCRLERETHRLAIPDCLPDYGDFSIKFYPAAGHILGPLSMLAEIGSGPGSSDYHHLVEYFKHYLVAMQINDDAHDWKEDLVRGHISTAVFRMLQLWKSANPEATHIDLESDIPELEELFWFRALESLCESALMHTRRSREGLRNVSLIETYAPLEQFIERSERTAREALERLHTSREIVRIFT